MKVSIRHRMAGRFRLHIQRQKMTYQEENILLYQLGQIKQVTRAKVYVRTCDMVIYYEGDSQSVLDEIRAINLDSPQVPEYVLELGGNELSDRYKEKLIQKVLFRYASKLFCPAPLRSFLITAKALPYIFKGMKTLWKRKIEVAVLDATAIGVSILRNDINTAGSVMFLLGIGELLEEWTHKKSVDDLAKTMALNVSKVWTIVDGQQVMVPVSEIQSGDQVVVHMGNVIPFDGPVVDGEATVNQSSLTGESEPVRKTIDSFVYAGTVVEEGEITLVVKETKGASKYEKIVTMIEESEKLKSSVEGKAEHLADRLVPYTLAGTLLTYALTRNITKALSVLMVDFSCALKLAMPISVLSAIREAGSYQITVKGGKFLEAIARADTIVFDKTGTLTKAEPRVMDVISFNGQSKEEMLRIAACLEEHFPHSVAKAVVGAAKEQNIEHEEMHTKVDYIVAHGISTTINGKKAMIGSYHFIFEDEGCQIPEGKEDLFENLPEECSHLYLSMEGKLAAVICIADPLREEAKDVIQKLRERGIDNIIMMTGDSERTAKDIAAKVGIDEFYAEVLPEDKAKFAKKEKEMGRTVIMIGDGINDSPALSAADVGIAISDGAQIAREIADVTIEAADLHELVVLKDISDQLMKRIQRNYGSIVGINSVLIGLGVLGLIQPTTSALLHNTSTLAISLQSMKSIVKKS